MCVPGTSLLSEFGISIQCIQTPSSLSVWKLLCFCFCVQLGLARHRNCYPVVQGSPSLPACRCHSSFSCVWYCVLGSYTFSVFEILHLTRREMVPQERPLFPLLFLIGVLTREISGEEDLQQGFDLFVVLMCSFQSWVWVVWYPFVSWELFFKRLILFLFERVTEREETRQERSVLYLLAHSPDGHNSWNQQPGVPSRSALAGH